MSGRAISETRSYNSLKQLTSIYAYGAIETGYGYPSSNNNGKIASQNDAISGETVTYTYDALNRLASATNSGASPSWGQSFAYDGFGNLTQTNVTQGSAPMFTASYNSNNQVGNEDANGNPPSVPLPAYGTGATPTFDVENRLVQLFLGFTSPAINYAYDPANHRVWRYNPNNSPTTDEITFWSITGQKLGTYQLTYNAGNGGCCYGEGNYQAPQFTVAQTDINLYFGAKLIKNKTGWVYPDRLGSIGKFYPYGIERPSATTNDTEKFTGYFRDAESGNDYAVNRYQSPGYGRFLTPDPHSSPNASDPGSWNKYAYTRGDPVNRVDRVGTDDEDADCDLGSCFLTDTFYINTAPYETTNDGFENDCLADLLESDGFENPTAAADICGPVVSAQQTPPPPPPPPPPPGPSCTSLLTTAVSSALAGTPLASYVSAFVSDAQSDNLNPLVLVAIAGEESNYGNYSGAKRTQNAFGLMHAVKLPNGKTVGALNNYVNNGGWLTGIAAAADTVYDQIQAGNNTFALLYSGQLGAYCVTGAVNGVRPPCSQAAGQIFQQLTGLNPNFAPNLLWPCPPGE